MSTANFSPLDSQRKPPHLPLLSSQPLGTPAHEWATSTEAALAQKEQFPQPVDINPYRQSQFGPAGGYSGATTPGFDVPGAWVGPRPDPVTSADTIGADVGSTLNNLGQTAYNYLPQRVLDVFQSGGNPPITTTTNHPSIAGPPGSDPPRPLEGPGLVQQAKDVARTAVDSTRVAASNLATGAQNVGASVVETATPHTSEPSTQPASGPVGHPPHPAENPIVGPSLIQQAQDAWGSLKAGIISGPGPVDPSSVGLANQDDDHHHGGVGNLPGTASETDVVRLPEERVAQRSQEKGSTQTTQTQLRTNPQPDNQHALIDRMKDAPDAVAATVLPAAAFQESISDEKHPSDVAPTQVSPPSATHHKSSSLAPHPDNENILAAPLDAKVNLSDTGIDQDVQKAILRRDGDNSPSPVPDNTSTNTSKPGDNHTTLHDKGSGALSHAKDKLKIHSPARKSDADGLVVANDPLFPSSGHDSRSHELPSSSPTKVDTTRSPHHQGPSIRDLPTNLHTTQQHAKTSSPTGGIAGRGVDMKIGLHSVKGEKEPDSHFYRSDHLEKTSAGAAASGALASEAPFHVHDHKEASISSTLATKSTVGASNKPRRASATAASPSSPRSSPLKFGTFGRKSQDSKRNGTDNAGKSLDNLPGREEPGSNNGHGHSQTSSSDAGNGSPTKVSFKDKLKGEFKVISGKITRDEAKVEQGRLMKSGGGSAIMDGPARVVTH